MKNPTLRLALAAIILTGTLHAQVPRLINYQGRVAVNAVNFDGPGQFKFALVDSGGATTYWSNDGTSAAGSQPVNAVALPVTKGLYSVLLGDIALVNMTALPAGAFTNPDVRLRVWFNDGVNGSQLLTPDQRLAPAAYLADGAVTATTIADGAILAAKIAPGTIDASRLAPASLDFSRLLVPNPPAAGQVLGFNGASLLWTVPGKGDGIWTVDAFNRAYFNGGNVGIGTSTPAAKLTLHTDGSPFVDPTFNSYGFEHTNGDVRLTTFVDDGVARFGTRSNHPLHLFVNDGLPSVIIDGSGTSITAGLGTWAVGSPNSESGSSIKRNGNRADLRFDGATVKMVAGPGNGPPGSLSGIVVNTAGNVGIGTTTPQAKLHVVGTTRTSMLTITGGADIAEPFWMKEEGLEKGCVVVIDEEHPGHLRRSVSAYDTRVAGIVSGANGINAGIALHQEGALEGGQNVALSGRVYVHADATFGPIKPGDLLTTSDNPGHAMKVGDHTRAQGAILGKAMSALDEGQGMVLVLVTLQ